MMLGLLRWASIHWTLAQAYAIGTDADRTAIGAMFAGLNSLLGNYVGEFLGELSFSLFFLLSGLAMLARGARFPRWVGYLGVLTAVTGMIGMFRNVIGFVDPVAAVNNYLLPLWMVIFGVALLRHRDGVPEELPSIDSLTA
jgi:drug/metabolite transporter (DMT)-like permease